MRMRWTCGVPACGVCLNCGCGGCATFKDHRELSANSKSLFFPLALIIFKVHTKIQSTCRILTAGASTPSSLALESGIRGALFLH
jgi:hypothetical protein